MRTLAVQSANGTYQDDVDRDAIQLEFDQLNDELNQIADTDFNGVIVLNGGQMADGTVAVNNKFDYTTGARNAKQLGANDVTLTDGQPFDNSLTGTGGHGRTNADNAWNDLNSNWDRADSTASNGPDSVDVTFKYDASTGDWSCTGASDGADYNAISTINNTDNGGFSFETANSGGAIANVVMDESQLKNGDTITLTMKNPYGAVSAPTNAGSTKIDPAAGTFTEGTASNAVKLDDADLKVEVDSGLTDAKMTETINKIFDAFNGAEVEFTYNSGAATVVGDIKVSGGGLAAAGYTGAAGAVQTLADGTTKFYAATDANGKITISALDAAGTGAGTTLFTIEPTKQASTANGSSGSVKYTLGFENYAYDTSKKPSVEVKKPEDAGVSKSNSWNQSKAKMTYADNMTLQVGARTKDSVNFTFEYSTNDLGGLKANMNCSAREDGLNTANLSLKTAKDANYAIDQIDKALNKTNMVRATFGAIQNRLEHKISNIDTNAENMTAAESRIRDTQMDKEMMKFTSSQILSQASQSMLAQANSLPQGVLQLLG
jgi:flagellin